MISGNRIASTFLGILPILVMMEHMMNHMPETTEFLMLTSQRLIFSSSITALLQAQVFGTNGIHFVSDCWLCASPTDS